MHYCFVRNEWHRSTKNVQLYTLTKRVASCLEINVIFDKNNFVVALLFWRNEFS